MKPTSPPPRRTMIVVAATPRDGACCSRSLRERGLSVLASASSAFQDAEERGAALLCMINVFFISVGYPIRKEQCAFRTVHKAALNLSRYR